jgi:leucyl aminopeptidase
VSSLLGIRIVTAEPAGVRTVIGVFSAARRSPRGLPPPLAAAVRAALARPGWRGGEEQVAEYAGDGAVVEVRGLGEALTFDARKLRAFVERAVESARAAGERRVAIRMPEHEVVRETGAGTRVVREAAMAGYRFERYLTSATPGALRSVLLVPAPGSERAWRAEAPAGTAIAEGIALARDLANTPPNTATPAWIARQARALARRRGGRVSVLGPAELERRGMGGILAVGAGSRNAPRMVRLELGRGSRTVALVGKGVTFDTGGISIKPAANMDEMKWDKCGACAVLGVIEAAARLDLPVRLRAYLPLAENMPDGTAYRPGDIVRCANGKSVEILNTDAEGRMILADALSWAASESPDYLVEFSTLTGACVVALGQTGAGLFTPDDRLAGSLLASAEKAGERLWRLPLWSEFLEDMRGAHADLRNSGGRWGGASNAAAFLSQFVAPVGPWAHLDIAGPAYVGEGRSRRGATGYGVALTVGWLQELARSGR